MTTPRPLDVTFTAPIEKDGAFATLTGTTDGHSFAASLMPSGTGPHWLPLRAEICAAIGKNRAGEEVTVHLQRRVS